MTTGENAVEDDQAMASEEPHFMCRVVGDSTASHDDPPTAAGQDAGGSSPGSAHLPPPSSDSTRVDDPAGSSTLGSAPHASGLHQPTPHPDPSVGRTDSAPASAEISSPGPSVAGAPASHPVAPQLPRPGPVTRLQQGIRKPKTYTDGTVRWGMLARSSTEEPATLDAAFNDKNWHAAMNSEYEALLKNKTWHLVPRPRGKNIIG